MLACALRCNAGWIVPGFFGTKEGGVIASLGRGGSDLSAVLLADELDATECELVKDVGGYFATDLNVDPRAEHIPQLCYEEALRMADDGCELVQQQAIEAARSARLRLVVRGLDEAAAASIVSLDGGLHTAEQRKDAATAEIKAQLIRPIEEAL